MATSQTLPRHLGYISLLIQKSWTLIDHLEMWPKAAQVYVIRYIPSYKDKFMKLLLDSC